MQRSLTRQARAEALLDTAIEVIRREGPACSIDDVAAAVGVTRPVIYRYFGSRDGLA
ncbi:MAG: TetR/AcrR family transcriptional regulator, partial [Acidimicrobiia bacterium]